MALQRQTWGAHFAELVPASLLKVTQEVGGIASGAFDGSHLAGFVFGISGIRDGRPVHWSDMLAVDPAYRGRGLGRRLKLHQRERLLDLGVDRMLWTFDPLVARNARLNLTRLGAIARTYRRDAYGASDSPLHRGIGTDRLLAEWDMRSPRVVQRIGGRTSGRDDEDTDDDALFLAPPLPAPAGSFPRPGPMTGQTAADRVRLAIPADIQALKEADPGLAAEWRRHTREALERVFAEGYTAVGVAPVAGGLAAYTLVRGLRR